jgi:hypothetical protein
MVLPSDPSDRGVVIARGREPAPRHRATCTGSRGKAVRIETEKLPAVYAGRTADARGRAVGFTVCKAPPEFIGPVHPPVG